MRSKRTGILLMTGLFVASVANAFYDASCETHVNVKNVKTDFGAVADGTTDDSAAFQAAVNWISANGGGKAIH